ncbi:MAG: hypothetical protein K9N29_10605 [Candidatus Marinimicrobia bacterium]|nr:hypothetical protein [Candidatus Neomarinimicrobiota bacterium]
MNDTWEIYKNNLLKWHWRRITPDGEVVGSGPRGYKNKADCEANARYNGWKKEESRGQGGDESQYFDNSNDSSGMGYKSGKSKFMSKHFIQQNLLKLIATILGLMLLVLTIMLFEKDPEPKLSDNRIWNIHSLINSDISGDSEFTDTGLTRGLFT